MDKKIISILKKNKGSISVSELVIKLKMKVKDLDYFLKSIHSDYSIIKTLDNFVFLLTDYKKYHIGVLKLHPKGFGFVNDLNNLENNDSFFVAPVSLNNAIKDDLVVYDVVEEEDGRTRAEIKGIVERKKTQLIGTIQPSYNGCFLDFIPNDIAFSNYRFIMVNKNKFKLEKNQLYKVKILEVRERKIFVKIEKLLGSSLKAADRILSVAEEFSLLIDFSQSTLINAESINQPVNLETQELERRSKNSLEKYTFVTIDGKESKDLDDAIYVEKIGDKFKLIVAIADVSYYVKSKSALDEEALIRGNSTYLANIVLPMLPKILSDDLCSLNPQTKKLAMACEMIFDGQGNMLTKKVYETVIISQARLTYDECNKYFLDQKWDYDSKISKILNNALVLYKKIRKIRKDRGMLNLDVSEPKIIMDKDSNVIDIKPRISGDAEQLIEHFMISANEAVATLVFEKNFPFIYRNHQKPSEDNLTEWYSSLKLFGVNPKMTNKEMLDSNNLNKALIAISSQSANDVESELLHLSLLRHLDKAKYSLTNIGHFGLASQCYTHFTSPIRRYADLLVHRYLKEYIIENKSSKNLQEYNARFIEKACLIINETEIKSIECEREVVKICMVEYMQDKINNTYKGVISVALKFGFFVQLDNLVEGLVHISTLGEGVTYDEKTQTLIKSDNTFYRMGQEVKIKVSNVSIQKRNIDFILV